MTGYFIEDDDPRDEGGWPFITRSDFDRFLTGLVETKGEGGIAGYRLDEGGWLIHVHIRHRLRNLLRPTRRAGITATLQKTIDYGRRVGVQVIVLGSYTPLWLRPNAAKVDPR